MNPLHITTEGQGPALVFLHGWAFTHRVWCDVASVLRARYTCYLVDLPGFGRSAYMSFENFAQFLLQAIPAPAHVLGWSLGGLYAMRLAIEYSAWVRSLMVISSSPCFIEKNQWHGVTPQRLEDFYHKIQLEPHDVMRDFLALQLRGVDTARRPVYDAIHYHNMHGLLAGLGVLQSWDLRTALHACAMPVGFMFGRLDAIVPYSVKMQMQIQYPQYAYYTFLKAAHMPFVSHRDLFIANLERFISCQHFL